MKISLNAGKTSDKSMLINVSRIITSYYTGEPDLSISEQIVSFSTSGHRGSCFKNSFSEKHIPAITQVICLFRQQQKIGSPLFPGMDIQALSAPAFTTALEVLSANAVDVMIAGKEEFTPTPVISHAILSHNKGRNSGFADGIVITPSHNPPDSGGFKYNPPNEGPAETSITDWIESKTNEVLINKLKGVKSFPFEKSLKSLTRHCYDYLDSFIDDLANIIDMDVIRNSDIKLAVDPMGGAGVPYWEPIAERYNLNLTVVNKPVDPTFRFMTADWDGQIRMDPSSFFAMQGLIQLKDNFEIAFACDPDHDRYCVTKTKGLLPPNHYLSVAIDYLFRYRPKWRKETAIDKTLVSSQIIDRTASRLGRKFYEVPVGFKWFSEGLLNGSFGFVGEESTGTSFVRFDGSVWTTNKDGIILALLAAEITASKHRDPGEIYNQLTGEFGDPAYERIDAPATPKQKELLKKLSPQQFQFTSLVGEKVISTLSHASDNGAPIGDLKVVSENGWFAARPSGTENIYKIYAESFKRKDHLNKILKMHIPLLPMR